MSTYIFLTFVTNFENVFAFFVTCLAQNISVKLHNFLINIYVIECWHEILFGASIILHNELYFENSLTTKINFGAPNVSMKVKLEKRHRTNFSRSHPLAACIWFPLPRKHCPCHLQQPNFLNRSAHQKVATSCLGVPNYSTRQIDFALRVTRHLLECVQASELSSIVPFFDVRQVLSKITRKKNFVNGSVSFKMKLEGSRWSKPYYFICKRIGKIRVLQTNKGILRTATYNSQIFCLGPLIKKLQLAA